MQDTVTAAPPETITFRMGGRVFWAYFWRVLVLVMAGEVVIGVSYFISHLLFGILCIAVLPLIFYLYPKVSAVVYSKTYPRFSVAMVDYQGVELPADWRYGIKPWWSKFWRIMLISMLYTIPIFMVWTPKFMAIVQAQEEYTDCAHFKAAYESSYGKPDQAVQLQAATAAYQQHNCNSVLARPVPKPPMGHGMLLVSILFGLVGILIQIKIFQIVLRKRYSNFYVRVVHRV